MNLEEKIAQAAIALLRTGLVAPCIPGLAARRSATVALRPRSPGRDRLSLESGGMPVIPPSARREVRI
jgi:hypothetical protein